MTDAEVLLKAAIDKMPLHEALKLLSLGISERWAWCWKATVDSEEALYGPRGDEALNRLVLWRARRENPGGKCVCFEVQHYEASPALELPERDVRVYFSERPPPLKDARGKMCGRCGGTTPPGIFQDCGFCGRAIYRRGPGGWTSPNRCVGCDHRSVPDSRAPGDFCTCYPLAGFKPRRRLDAL